MKKPAVWLGVLFCALVLGYLVLSSFRGQRARCEVCMVFDGRRNCRTASAETREAAQRAAVENACALIASGVSDSSRCLQTPPESVRWIQ